MHMSASVLNKLLVNIRREYAYDGVNILCFTPVMVESTRRHFL